MLFKGKSAGSCTFLFGIYPGPWLHHLTGLDYNAKLDPVLSCLVVDTRSGTTLTFSDSSTSQVCLLNIPPMRPPPLQSDFWGQLGIQNTLCINITIPNKPSWEHIYKTTLITTATPLTHDSWTRQICLSVLNSLCIFAFLSVNRKKKVSACKAICAMAAEIRTQWKPGEGTSPTAEIQTLIQLGTALNPTVVKGR